MVSPADSTVAYIRRKVRRLTASASEASLPTSQIDQAINNFYNFDFPYAIKLDVTRSVYTFYTEPNIDKYPLDVNYNQGVREPVYFEGIRGSLFKDRDAFYAMWPRWPTKFQPITGDGVTTAFNFTIGGTPFLRGEVVLGGVDINGNAISVADDGNGNLQLQVPKPIVTIPPYTDLYTIANAPVPSLVGQPIPGMHNQNTLNPGLNNVSTQTTPFTNAIGTVDYVTGAFSINFPVAPTSGQQMTLWVSQYQTGRPYSLLFWNNYFIVRPVPKLIHKVEVETYLSPVQFMATTDNPILNQWAKYIAMGAAMDILNDRQDTDGVDNVGRMFKEQEALVLERNGVEEIGQRNSTIFSSTQQTQGWNNGSQGWFGG
jgi:hypothetical protein